MYCEHFGFSEKPFDVTPDPNFLYLSPAHEEMLASIIYGIQERRGFIAIVGEVGTGKTTLLNAALDKLDRNTRVAYIFNTDVTFHQLLQMALVDLGLAKANARLSKIDAIQRLNDFAIDQLAIGGNVALIIDEAQNLDLRTLENLRLLSNLETPKQKLVQIVLSGQPELDQKLNQSELRQLAQRISLRRQISPLDETQTYEYIRHRLSKVGYNGADLFSPQAQQLIWAYSGGVPRKINILCDNALLTGYGLRTKEIEAAVVEETIQDLGWDPGLEPEKAGVSSATHFELVEPPPKKKASPARIAWLLILLALALTFGLWLYMGKGF
jgi:general secretion pathway protein A